MKQIIVIFIILFFAACQKNPTSPSTQFDNRPIINENNLSKITISLIDYNVIHLLHQSGLDLRSSNIISIIIGMKKTQEFKQLYFSNSSFDQDAKVYLVHFDFTIRMDSSLINAPLTIRYLSSDSSYIDFDTTVALYKYPYSSTEIISDSTILPSRDPFQDISRLGSKLYYHPLGPWGLLEYDLVSKSSKMLCEYTSGDHLVADSNYVFCDISHNSVSRYNTTTNMIDFIFPLPADIDIWGMAVLDYTLYININANGYYLKKYTYQGKFLDSIAYPKEVYYLAIYDSIAYSCEYFNNAPTQLSRFDLRSRAYLSNVLSPSYSIDGIKSYGDRLYFCDFYKKCVSSVPMKDLIEVGVLQNNSKKPCAIR